MKFILLLLLSTSFFCCKKETVNGLDAVSARLPNSSTTSYIQHGTTITINGREYTFLASYVGVPITLKTPAKSQDTIIASVDTALVAAYNTIYVDNNPMIPSDAFKVSHDGVFPISSGSSQAIDSLYVLLNDVSKLKHNTTYLIPISLQSKHGASLSYSLFFLKMTYTIGDLRARMDFANVWTRATTSFWSRGSLLVNYSSLTSLSGVMQGPDSIRFSTTLNNVFNSMSVRINAEVTVNDSIIKAYSTSSGTTHIAFPADSYELRRSTVTVLPGSTKSRDSLCVVFKDKTKFRLRTWYLLGLKIKSTPGDSLSVPPVASDSSRAFIRLYVN